MCYDPKPHPDDDYEYEEIPYDEDFVWDEDVPAWGGF